MSKNVCTHTNRRRMEGQGGSLSWACASSQLTRQNPLYFSGPFISFKYRIHKPSSFSGSHAVSLANLESLINQPLASQIERERERARLCRDFSREETAARQVQIGDFSPSHPGTGNVPATIQPARRSKIERERESLTEGEDGYE